MDIVKLERGNITSGYNLNCYVTINFPEITYSLARSLLKILYRNDSLNITITENFGRKTGVIFSSSNLLSFTRSEYLKIKRVCLYMGTW
jgi:hypothetical protein